jgi:[ribosomal protein S5]-alanine N-acetyltransferase
LEFPTLATSRLHLVEIRKQHTDAYFNIMSQDIVTKFYGMDSLQHKEQATQIIESFNQTFQRGTGIRWGIILKESGTFIGTVGLNNLVKRMKRTEIGYEIHPNYWSNGYTSEAVKRVIDFCFQELGLHRIGAITFPENKPSWSLLQKLHFEKEGLLRGYLFQHGRSNDAFVFSLIRPEWENQ